MTPAPPLVIRRGHAAAGTPPPRTPASKAAACQPRPLARSATALLLIALAWAVAPALATAQSGAAATAPSRPAMPAAPASAERSVRPGINDPYRDPRLNVRELAEGFAGESREAYAARFDVLRAMALKPGQRIADIGAGTGIYVPLFAGAVGPRGRVYAVDIAPPLLKWIEATAKRQGLAQVTTVLGTDRTTNLAEASVDVVFSSDVYHHFEYPQTMLADLSRALVSGGTMYVLDFERIEGVSSDWILGHVRAGKETVIREIEAAGFELVREVDLPVLRENYLLQFRKR